MWFHSLNIHINVEYIMPLYFKYTYYIKRDRLLWKDPDVRLHGDSHREMLGWSRSLCCRILAEKIIGDMLLLQIDMYNQCL